MTANTRRKSLAVRATTWPALLLLAAGLASAGETKVKLSGDSEVPPVQTAATGSGTISVKDDKSISGSVTTKGIQAIAAHVHQAAAGKNGPPIISLEKTAEGVWSIPQGARLTDEQYASYKAGDLYVNVHSPEHKNGEIRGQLKP
jgi:hypothetical protein